ncbi:MAG: hypothetical protein GX852_00150, partial [Clostridiales bacterium]|nr:hypothetical protein [Clostridiales bacterium]
IKEKPTFQLPINQLTSLGVAIKPLASAIQSTITGPGGSGFYYVNTSGKKMFAAKDGSGFIGSLQNSVSGTVGGGQARMTTIPCDPTMIFAAAALMQIEKKLDDIQETQLNIIEFLEEDKKSKLTANLNFLSEEIGKYKLNYNDTVYINATLTTAKIISRDGSADIDFYSNRIEKALNNKKFFSRDSEIKKKLAEVQLNFKYYQMALYVYAFATFLQTMLQKNFKSDNLNLIADTIRKKALLYRDLYTKCYARLEDLSGSSIESLLVGGMADANTKAGNVFSKIPALEKINLDDGFLAIGNKLQEITDEKTDKVLNGLLSCKNPFVSPFLESLENVDILYNKPKDIYFDAENIYYFDRNVY